LTAGGHQPIQQPSGCRGKENDEYQGDPDIKRYGRFENGSKTLDCTAISNPKHFESVQLIPHHEEHKPARLA
jgi:hypothetical protein